MAERHGVVCVAAEVDGDCGEIPRATVRDGRDPGSDPPRVLRGRVDSDQAAFEVRGEPRERERDEEEDDHDRAVDLEGVDLAVTDGGRRE
jgi:hypothetical protein